MEEENKVSVWASNFSTGAEFQSYIATHYDDEGNMSSPFMAEAGLDYYDEDMQETLFDASPNPDAILNQFSYSGSFMGNIPAESIPGCNSFLLLYDFSYTDAGGTGQMKFIGTFDYQK